MRKFLEILFIVFVLIISGGVAAFYLGGQTLVTYHPNGQVKSSIQKRFFKSHGLASFYNENGTLSQQYTYKNGVKDGVGYFYFAGQPLRVTYQNNVLTGPATFENAPYLKDFFDPKITFLPKNMIEVSLKKEKNTSRFQINRLCTDEAIVENLQAYINSFQKEYLKRAFSCLSVKDITLTADNSSTCHFTGAYKYPNFKSDFEINCDMHYETKTPLFETEKIKFKGTFDLAKDKFSIEAFDPQKPDSNFYASYGGLNKIVEGVSQMFMDAQKEEYIYRFLRLMLENFTSSNSMLQINGQKIWEVSGDFNMMTGFSDPYYISSYMDNLITSQFKIDDSGLNLKALYPISKKPMLSLGFNVSESFKTIYRGLIEDLSTFLTAHFNSQKKDTADLFSKLPDYADKFSNLFEKFYGTLFDNKGHKVVSGSVFLKEGLDSNELITSPITAFTMALTTYENNQPIHQITGDFENGFLLDGQPTDEDTVFSLVGNKTVLNTFQQISNELEQKFGPLMQNEKIFDTPSAIDPFLFGMYAAMAQTPLAHNSPSFLSDVEMLILNINTLYAGEESYLGLNEQIAIEQDILPEEMFSSDGLIYHTYGGNVFISTSAAISNGEDGEAFEITMTNLPSDVCVELVSYPWGDVYENFIAVEATDSDTSEIATAYVDEPFKGRESGASYGQKEAAIACGKSNTSLVALKFF